jgi:hypothetical protein
MELSQIASGLTMSATHNPAHVSARAWHVASDRYQVITDTIRDGVVIVFAGVTFDTLTLKVMIVAKFVLAYATEEGRMVLR